jgi:LysM repeat protein
MSEADKGLFILNPKTKISTKLKILLSLVLVLIISVPLILSRKERTSISSNKEFFLSDIEKDISVVSETSLENYLANVESEEGLVDGLMNEKEKLYAIRYIKYRVNRGDTPAKIAKKFGINLDDLLAFNGLRKNESLKVGQTIKIPGVASIPTHSIFSYIGRFVKAQTWVNGLYIPVSGFNWGIPHGKNASDIAAPCGSPVYAAKSGVIITSADGWNDGYGKFIKIQHEDGSVTIYAHLMKRFVSVGDYVESGTLIGLVGNTGYVYGQTGCHLHFEVRGAPNPLLTQ